MQDFAISTATADAIERTTSNVACYARHDAQEPAGNHPAAMEAIASCAISSAR